MNTLKVANTKFNVNMTLTERKKEEEDPSDYQMMNSQYQRQMFENIHAFETYHNFEIYR